MGGGLMQLVAYGAQDVYLTGNPQITFFKVVYRRHTNFAVEAIEQTFNGAIDFGRKSDVQITRNGDLITKMYLKATLESSYTEQTVQLTESTTETIAVGAAVATVAAGDISLTVTPGLLGAAGFLTITDNNAVGSMDAVNFAVGKVVQISASTAGGNDGYYIVKTYTDADNIIVTPLTGGVTSANDATAVITAHDHVEWVEEVGHAMIKSVELQIGGTKIDKHYGEWLHIWQELTRCCHTAAVAELIGDSNRRKTRTLFVPLQFFCCRNDGLALPLIALQYHDVRVSFEMNTAANCCSSGSTSASIANSSLLVDYIYLDSEERKRFAQASHEYLIEQLQYTGVESGIAGTGNKFRLNFNHPCKELLWVVRKAGGDSSANKFINFTNDNTLTNGTFGTNTVIDAQLQLNGHDRMSKQSGKYFQNVQVLEHHSNTPNYAGINVYSFALNAQQHQPSGTCNFSRIDNAQLNMNLASPGDVHIFATSYNVLRIMSGMGGLAYSN